MRFDGQRDEEDESIRGESVEHGCGKTDGAGCSYVKIPYGCAMYAGVYHEVGLNGREAVGGNDKINKYVLLEEVEVRRHKLVMQIRVQTDARDRGGEMYYNPDEGVDDNVTHPHRHNEPLICGMKEQVGQPSVYDRENEGKSWNGRKRY